MKHTLAILSLALLTAATAGRLQRRAKPAGPEDFEKSVKAALTEFSAKHYGRALQALGTASGVARNLWVKVVGEAFPAAPAGWTRTMEDTEQENQAVAVFGLGQFAGTAVKASYEGPDGKSFELAVHLDSGMVKTLKAVFDNPLLAGQAGEPIEYDGYKGFLEKQDSDSSTLKILLFDRHYIEARGAGISAEDLLQWMSQANVDRIGAAARN